LAQQESRLLNHNFIGSEHILMGLIQEGQGVAAKALESLGISLEAVREKVEETIGSAAGIVPAGSPPFTPRTKKVLELSQRESVQMGHSYIGTEHMLLGLVREEEAAQILVSLGAEPTRVRQTVVQLLSGYQSNEGASGAQGEPDALGRTGARSGGGPPGEPPTCLTCRAGLAQQGVWSTLSLPSAERGGAARSFTFIRCQACGTVVAVLPGDAIP
jgi:ATP-dependent Clp protease ATP-binding subunit ClpC